MGCSIHKYRSDPISKYCERGFQASIIAGGGRGRWSEPGRAYMVTKVTENRAPVFADLMTGRVVVREMMRLENEGR